MSTQQLWTERSKAFNLAIMKSTAAKASLVFAGLLFSFALLAPSSHSLLGLRQHSEVDGWRQGDSHTSLSPISDKRVSEVFNETLGVSSWNCSGAPVSDQSRSFRTFSCSPSHLAVIGVTASHCRPAFPTSPSRLWTAWTLALFLSKRGPTRLSKIMEEPVLGGHI